MHEMSLVRKLTDIVLDECQGRSVSAVRRVHLSIGEISDVVEDQIPGLFRHFARGTVAADAEVVVTRVPAFVRCRRCSNIFRIETRGAKAPKCDRCGSDKDYVLFSGREFRVDSIEVEALEREAG